MPVTTTKLHAATQLFSSLVRSKYFVVIAEVLLMTVLTFASFSILLRLTDAKTIGLWVLLNSILSFSKVADFWSAGLVTFVAEDLEQKQTRSAGKLVSTSVVTAAFGFLGVAVLVGIFISLFAAYIPGVEDVTLVQRIVPLMCLTFWLVTVAGTYQVGFLGFDRPVFKLLQNVGGSLVFLILVLFLVPRFGLWGILQAQAAQGLFSLLFGTAVFHGYMLKSSPLVWQYGDFSRLSSYGSKASVVGILQLATEPLIKVLASQFGGLASVTQIELATRMIVALRGLIMSVGQLLVPAFARAAVQGNTATQELYAVTRQIFVALTIPLIACVLAIAPLIELIVFGQMSAEFVAMVWFLSLGWGSNIVTAPAFFLLSGRRNLRPLFWNRLLMLIAVLVCGAVGGHLFGILGVTSGVMIGLVAASGVVLKAATQFGTPVRFRISSLGSIGLAVFTSAGCFFAFQNGASLGTLMAGTVLSLIGIMTYALVTIPFGNFKSLLPLIPNYPKT